MALRDFTRADLVCACARVRAIAAGDEVRVVACDVSALAAELAAVEALARLALVARRLGCALRMRRPSPELRDLVALCGLSDALGVWRNGGQLEQGKEPVHVQERVDRGDAPA